MDDNKNENEETSLEKIDEPIEETENYQTANIKEKLSLKIRKKFISNNFHTVVLVLFLLVVFWGINIWAKSKNLAQIDVTASKLYSLTQTSKDQLATLNKDVNIYIYGYKEDNAYVQFIRQYNAFNSKIYYEVVNEATNYEVVTKYGLGDYNSIVVACGEKYKILYPDYEFASYDYVTDNSVDITEQSITNAILNVSTDDPVKIYFATGNREYETSELTYLVAELEAQVYECIDLNLLTVTEIPEDCDVLAIMDPQEDLSEGAVNIIIDYINRGGNIIFSSLATDEKWSNIQKILDLYGVKINYGILYEGNANNSYAYENTSIIPYILVPNLGASNKITSDLSKSKLKVIMPWAQSLSINNVEEDGVTVLRSDILTTSEKCYNITDLNSALTSESLKSLDASQYVIGTELTRKTTKLNEEGNEEKTESKLIIYANTTFYADYYQLGSIQLQPITFFGNVNLALNSFAELAEQDNLITIRKSTNVTTFQSTTQEDRVVKFIIFGIPVLIILAGIIVWNFRRRKR